MPVKGAILSAVSTRGLSTAWTARSTALRRPRWNPAGPLTAHSNASIPSEVPEPEDVGPDDPPSAAVRAFIAQHTRALLRADLTDRYDPDGVSAVHQMRGGPRLRNGLRRFWSPRRAEWARSGSDSTFTTVNPPCSRT